ncbi:hypothetical protein FRC11_011411 [Ceratobasidium sp. 423]|nr:hypothetical protein FRC11_011411 [Ceratobasidium sp. 423]
MTTAWALKKEWPDIELHIVPDAGHSPSEPGIAKLLTEVWKPNYFRELKLIIPAQAADKFVSL